MKTKHNKHKKSHYNKKHCTPFKKNKLSFSCLSHNSLIKIAKSMNKLGHKIKYNHISDKKLHKIISKEIEDKYKCKNEACWLNIKELMKQLKPSEVEYLQDYFRPHLPKELVKDYTEWLSNFDIEDALYKHSRNLHDFYFYGAVPIDFNKCSVSDLCRINIKKHLENQISKIGIVFNTDDSSGPGQHWMSMYIDLNGKNLDGSPGIYFFDSFGSNPSKEIKDLISKIKKQGKSINKEFIVFHNDKSYQKNTYACGFYCMHFLENMLQGIPFKRYLTSGLNDKKMKRYITQCYLHPEEIKC